MDRPAALTSGAFRRPRWLVPVAAVGGLLLLVDEEIPDLLEE